MPARKSGSSEAPSETSTKTSLRRLSSIASFQVLNPFSRRRSNGNHTVEANSSSSNLSLSSTTANPPQPVPPPPPSKLSVSGSSAHEAPVVPLQPMPATSKRATFVCLPDDPIGGMPRSRTLSNLPLPTRLRKTTPMMPSKSHSRLPSTALPSAARPSTRLPSPPTTNRKHSTNHSVSVEARQHHLKNRMVRSDTEPLMAVNVDQINNIPRSTAFKENIFPGPVRPLGNKNAASHWLPSSSHTSLRGLSDVSEGGIASRQDSLPNLLSLSRYHAEQAKRSPKYASSPAYQTSKDRPPTPGASKPEPMQRWNSQPILSNTSTFRSSQHGEIKQVRLMSERQPPTPPPARTPAGMEAIKAVRTRSSSTLAHLRHASEMSPSEAQQRSKPASPKNIYEIHKAEPVSYWCGRFAALDDRFRNEELFASLGSPASTSTSSSSTSKSKSNFKSNSNFWPRHESDKMHSPEANTARRRRAIEQLYNLCTTVEARDSFVKFQLQFAALQNDPDLARPVASERFASNMGVGVGGCGVAMMNSEVRKTTFMERLLGRGGRVRRSLV